MKMKKPPTGGFSFSMNTIACPAYPVISFWGSTP
jgi:hypothetical protein